MFIESIIYYYKALLDIHTQSPTITSNHIQFYL